jgi:uncharacterized protein YcbK (DUF882 family)
LVAVLLLATAAAAAPPPPRFFVVGGGRIALTNAHTGEKLAVRYRGEDGRYDKAALARIRHLFRSRDGGEGDVSLRLVEVLSYLQAAGGSRRLTVMSGYRSPGYNERLKGQGKAVAGGSLHTEGLAADLAFPSPTLKALWERLRALDCCGAGYYAREGFLHVDVGRPRFWEAATSRVGENLSAGNARLFAQTDYDRYTEGEELFVTLHALTEPPVLVRPAARLPGDGEGNEAVTLDGPLPRREGCFEIGRSGLWLRVPAVPARAARVRLVLTTCEPRPAATPAEIETNAFEVRRAAPAPSAPAPSGG